MPDFSFSIQAQTIAGNWKLTLMVIEVDMAYSINAPITLSIAENGKINGSSGCNSFTGSYLIKKPKKTFKKPLKIKFADVIESRIPCQKPFLAENAFLKSLRKAATFFIKDSELFIENTKTGNQMIFVKD